MPAREALYRLVDALPERDLSTAARILEALSLTADPVERSLKMAPFDDEPDDDDFDGGLTEARQQALDGDVVSHEGALTRQHFIEDRAESPHVGSLVHALAFGLLWAHVGGRAHDDAGARRCSGERGRL